MTAKEWNEIVKVLNVMYEKDGKLMFDADTPEKISVWYSCLNDLEYKPCCEAIKRFALTSKFRPTIADIREHYVAVTNPVNTMSESEAWSIVRMALRDSSYHAQEQFDAFPDIIKKAVVTPDRLREWGQMPSDTVGSVVRAEFRRSYESAANSVQQERQMGRIGVSIAEQIAEKLKNGLAMTRDEIQIGMKEG